MGVMKWQHNEVENHLQLFMKKKYITVYLHGYIVQYPQPYLTNANRSVK